MAERQYVACKFRTSDTRTFTYHNDGEPVHDGDTVRVADRSGEGWKKVYVVSTTDEEPPFPTKPILGLHVDDDPELLTGAARATDSALDTPLAF